MRAEFDESLVTGDETIDKQHKELIQKINELLESCEKSTDKLKAVTMLGYLADYTEYHFKEEEKLQEEAGFPDYEDHKKQHTEFKKAVEELHEMLEEEEGPSEEFVKKVNEKVVEWLYNHIKIYDRFVAEYIHK